MQRSPENFLYGTLFSSVFYNLNFYFADIILWQTVKERRVAMLELLLIPGCMILFLYMLVQSAQKRKSPFLSLLWVILFLVITAFCVYFYAAVRAGYCAQNEWQQERQFFLNLFIQKLEASGDLKTAAMDMQSEEVTAQTTACIQNIIHAFHPRIVWGLLTGGVFLLLAAVSLWIKPLSAKKYYPLFLLLSVLIGTSCLNTGLYFQQYARKTDRYLKHFLHLQQSRLMKELSEIKTDLSIPEIIKITAAEAGRINGFGYGQILPEQIRSGKNSASDKK